MATSGWMLDVKRIGGSLADRDKVSSGITQPEGVFRKDRHQASCACRPEEWSVASRGTAAHQHGKRRKRVSGRLRCETGPRRPLIPPPASVSRAAGGRRIERAQGDVTGGGRWAKTNAVSSTPIHPPPDRPSAGHPPHRSLRSREEGDASGICMTASVLVFPDGSMVEPFERMFGRRPGEGRDPYAVTAVREAVRMDLCYNHVAATDSGGYGSPPSRGRRGACVSSLLPAALRSAAASRCRRSSARRRNSPARIRSRVDRVRPRRNRSPRPRRRRPCRDRGPAR